MNHCGYPAIGHRGCGSTGNIPVAFNYRRVVRGVGDGCGRCGSRFSHGRTLVFTSGSVFGARGGRDNTIGCGVSSARFVGVHNGISNNIGKVVRSCSPSVHRARFGRTVGLGFTVLRLYYNFSHNVFAGPRVSFTATARVVGDLGGAFSFIGQFEGHVDGNSGVLFGTVGVVVGLGNAAPVNS